MRVLVADALLAESIDQLSAQKMLEPEVTAEIAALEGSIIAVEAKPSRSETPSRHPSHEMMLP